MVKKKQKLTILAAGDIHGSHEIAERLAEKARKNKVDVVLLLGDIFGFNDLDIIKPFTKLNKKVLFIPGNWDSTIEAKMLEDIHKIRNLDGYYAVYNGIGIVGVGNPDFRMNLENEKTFDRINKNFDRMKADKRVLISHLHAAGTKAEFSGIKGSKLLRKAIDKFHPDLFLSAHIHEAEGIEEKIGTTKLINIGRKGKIIRI